MRILCAPDSFKGSLDALTACLAMERGIRRALCGMPCEVLLFPLADGGEGTLDALLRGAGGQRNSVRVSGPLGNPVQAFWASLPSGQAAIEMALASGLTLVEAPNRDAGRASSTGTGQVIKAALDAGHRALLVGIGGSATTDGGAGALQALGLRLLKEDGAAVPLGGSALRELAHIETAGLDPRLRESRITVLCDVTNPLCGPNGAARVYGPQKGASPGDVEVLDAALLHYATLAREATGLDFQDYPGAGAAGGMGYGLLTFAGAQLKPGIEVILEATQFAEKLETADLVLTGEGSIDVQTLSGKAIAGVAHAASVAKGGKGVPVIALGGSVKLSGEHLQKLGVLAAFPLPDGPMELGECIDRAEELLENAAERALRIWLASMRSVAK